MQSESRLKSPLAGASESEVVFRLPATNEGVRAGVLNASRLIQEVGAPAEDITAIELALAEVLNNVVEHALEGSIDGEMDLRIDSQPPHLYFRVIDTGHPMPGGRLPKGNAADTDREGFEQEEGGYGLYMIRQLARKLRYSREGHENHLSFRITLGAERHWENDVPL